ncbi:MAG: DUF2764 domain-containing protein [Odoribacter sp.]|nr:DUF2764 domain-containing protein [Odoribacter sp.]
MFKKDYTGFIAGLPEISWSERKLSLTVHDFREQAQDYIKGSDYDLINLFFLPNDNLQVYRLLNKQEPLRELDTVYPLDELEEEIQDADNNIPSYLRDFINDFKDEQFNYDVIPENVLSWMYYNYMMSSDNEFIAEYAEFSMNIKNLITALNSRKYGRSVQQEIIGNNDFSQALCSNTSRDFGLTIDYPWVEQVITLMENDNLVERERGLDFLLWDYLDEAVTFQYFSIERVIAFMLKLLILERWSKLDSDSGRRVFIDMIERFRNELKFE